MIKDTLIKDKQIRSKRLYSSLLFLCSFYIYLSLISFAAATPVVADLSNYEITMDSSFNGTRMFVFGARNDSGEVVVAVRGPNKNYIIRKKEAFAGIWVNKSRMKLFEVPSYYALASSKPLNEAQHESLYDALGIGNESLLANSRQRPEYADFANAFIEHQQQLSLYFPEPSPLTFMGETLFKTTIEFPDNIPPGTYTAEIYLLSDERVVGMQALPITIKKVGLDGFLFAYAHEQPLLYGIAAVLMALGAGWLAGRLFEKF